MAITTYEKKIDAADYPFTRPKLWQEAAALSAADLNTYLRSNMLFLRNKPRHILQWVGTGGDEWTTTIDWDTVTLAAPNPISPLVQVEFEVAAGDVEIVFASTGRASVSDNYLHFDILYDDAVFLSTLTSTPGANGLWNTDIIDNDRPVPVFFRWIHRDVPAGIHKWSIQWGRNNSSATASIGGAYPTQLYGIQR